MVGSTPLLKLVVDDLSAIYEDSVNPPDDATSAMLLPAVPFVLTQVVRGTQNELYTVWFFAS